MTDIYNGNYSFNIEILKNWNNKQGGVYYCGALNINRELIIYYIGKAFGDDGIKGRLLQHLNENKWSDITHFGYNVCSSKMKH